MDRLKKELSSQFEMHFKIMAKYQKALKECTPWDSNPRRSDPCKFCRETSHTDDCKYMKLINERTYSKECGEVEE